MADNNLRYHLFFLAGIVVIFLFLPGFAYAGLGDDLRDHAVVYYKLEENDNPYADSVQGLDVSNGGNEPDRVNGKINFGQSFTPANSDYQRTAHSEALEIASPFLAGWFKTDACGGQMGLMGNGNRKTSTLKYGLQLIVSPPTVSGCKITIAGCDGDASCDTFVYDNAPMLGKWAHIVAYYDHDIYLWFNATASGAETAEGATNLAYEAGTLTPYTIGAQYYASNPNYYYDGIIDETYMGDWDTFNISHATYLYASGAPGSMQQYNFSAPNANPVIVAFDYPTPRDHIDDWNGSIRINATDPDGLPFSCSINGDAAASIGGGQYQADGFTVTNANHTMTALCNDGLFNTTITDWFIHDSVFPSILDYAPAQGSEFVKNFSVIMPFDVTVQDLYLYRVNQTIFYPNGSVAANNDSGPMSQVLYSLNQSLNISTWPTGNYTLHIEAADTHTAKEFKEKVIIDGTSYKLKKGTLEFKLPNGATMDSARKLDRITQRFNFFDKPREFTIKADDLFYIADSEYPCHFIVNGRYWYDCQGLQEPVVERQNKNTYKISFIDTDGVAETHSLGGLNQINLTAWFIISELGPEPIPNASTIFTVKSKDTGGLITGANIELFADLGYWHSMANYSSDSWGRAIIPYNTDALYLVIVSAPGFIAKNISIGYIIYPDYLIELEGGAEMTPLIMILLGALALAFWIFSFGLKRVSTYFVAGILMAAFGAIIWSYSWAFGLGFLLSGIYSWIQILL